MGYVWVFFLFLFKAFLHTLLLSVLSFMKGMAISFVVIPWFFGINLDTTHTLWAPALRHCLQTSVLTSLKMTEMKVLFIQTHLIGNGGGVRRKEAEFYTMRKWIRRKRRRVPRRRQQRTGWKPGFSPPTQTHIASQLKKASSWCGKFQIYNNWALFIIGSMCAVGESVRGWERWGRWKPLNHGSHGVFGEVLYVYISFFSLSCFLPALPGFRALAGGGKKSGTISDDWAKARETHFFVKLHLTL